MTLIARLAGALALVLLAGCAPGSVTTTHVDYESGYSPYRFSYAAGGRDLRVVIRGNPTSAQQEEFDRAVIAAMQGKNWGPQTNFTTRPSESARKNYRVVMLFSGKRYAGGNALCGDLDGVDLAPVDGRVRLQAAFCQKERPLTQLQVTVDGVTSPADPRLKRMVTAAVLELFPPIDNTRDDDCPRRLPGNC